eukprot:12760099-Alexandrium_andersonii.AAC.1
MLCLDKKTGGNLFAHAPEMREVVALKEASKLKHLVMKFKVLVRQAPTTAKHGGLQELKDLARECMLARIVARTAYKRRAH